MQQINRILDTGTPDELMTWLQKPEGLLPVVDSSRPNLYMDNLKKAKADKGAVSAPTAYFLYSIFTGQTITDFLYNSLSQGQARGNSRTKNELKFCSYLLCIN